MSIEKYLRGEREAFRIIEDGESAPKVDFAIAPTINGSQFTPQAGTLDGNGATAGIRAADKDSIIFDTRNIENGDKTITFPNANGELVVKTAGSPIPVNQGGTGISTIPANNIIFGNGTGLVNLLPPKSIGKGFLQSSQSAPAPTWGNITWDDIVNGIGNTSSNITSAIALKHTQNTDKGTTENSFYIGSSAGGVYLRKDINGNLEITNSSSTLKNIKVASMAAENLTATSSVTAPNVPSKSSGVFWGEAEYDNRIITVTINDSWATAANLTSGFSIGFISPSDTTLAATKITLINSALPPGSQTLFTEKDIYIGELNEANKIKANSLKGAVQLRYNGANFFLASGGGGEKQIGVDAKLDYTMPFRYPNPITPLWSITYASEPYIKVIPDPTIPESQQDGTKNWIYFINSTATSITVRLYSSINGNNFFTQTYYQSSSGRQNYFITKNGDIYIGLKNTSEGTRWRFNIYKIPRLTTAGLENQLSNTLVHRNNWFYVMVGDSTVYQTIKNLIVDGEENIYLYISDRHDKFAIIRNPNTTPEVTATTSNNRNIYKPNHGLLEWCEIIITDPGSSGLIQGTKYWVQPADLSDTINYFKLQTIASSYNSSRTYNQNHIITFQENVVIKYKVVSFYGLAEPIKETIKENTLLPIQNGFCFCDGSGKLCYSKPNMGFNISTNKINYSLSNAPALLNPNLLVIKEYNGYIYLGQYKHQINGDSINYLTEDPIIYYDSIDKISAVPDVHGNYRVKDKIYYKDKITLLINDAPVGTDILKSKDGLALINDTINKKYYAINKYIKIKNI